MARASATGLEPDAEGEGEGQIAAGGSRRAGLCETYGTSIPAVALPEQNAAQASRGGPDS
ncbi:hypothetical protein [Streptomyces sp. NPDC002788]